jgi:hypothetical protein
METPSKRPKGRPRIDNNGDQRQIIQFSCSDGTKEVWRSYADNMDWTTTELFYKMVDHMRNQMRFILWLEEMAKHDNFIKETLDKNENHMAEWKFLSRLSDSVLMLNKGRLDKAQERCYMLIFQKNVDC